jgi:hypothetical protein
MHMVDTVLCKSSYMARFSHVAKVVYTVIVKVENVCVICWRGLSSMKYAITELYIIDCRNAKYSTPCRLSIMLRDDCTCVGCTYGASDDCLCYVIGRLV